MLTIMGGNKNPQTKDVGLSFRRERMRNSEDSAYSSGSLHDAPLNDHRWIKQSQIVIPSSHFQHAPMLIDLILF